MADVENASERRGALRRHGWTALLVAAAFALGWVLRPVLSNSGEEAAPVGAAAPASAPDQPQTAAATSDLYAGAELATCRQGSCVWEKALSVRTVKTLDRGTLKVRTVHSGTSTHIDSPIPERYAPNLAIEWERQPVETYVFCSLSQPAVAFEDRWEPGPERWIAHLLDLYATGGYNGASAATYMRVCHDTEFYRDDIEQELGRLGYRRGTRNEQVDLTAPGQLADPPPRS